MPSTLNYIEEEESVEQNIKFLIREYRKSNLFIKIFYIWIIFYEIFFLMFI